MVDRKFDFGFAVKLMRKDLGICLDHAGNNNISLPITSIVNQFYAEIQRNGGSKLTLRSKLLAGFAIRVKTIHNSVAPPVIAVNLACV